MKEHLALILFRINKAPISSWWHYLSPLHWFEGICQLLMMIVENATVGDLMIGGNAHTFCLPFTLVHLFWWFCWSRPVSFRSTLSFFSFVREHSLMDLGHRRPNQHIALLFNPSTETCDDWFYHASCFNSDDSLPEYGHLCPLISRRQSLKNVIISRRLWYFGPFGQILVICRELMHFLAYFIQAWIMGWQKMTARYGHEHCWFEVGVRFKFAYVYNYIIVCADLTFCWPEWHIQHFDSMSTDLQKCQGISRDVIGPQKKLLFLPAYSVCK